MADDSADLVEIHEVDNLDEHKARIGSYASAFFGRLVRHGLSQRTLVHRKLSS